MSDAVYTPAYNYTPDRDPQGKVIDKMKTYATTEIENVDASTMNCAIYTDFKSILNLISNLSHIDKDQVYPALVIVGRDICYSEFKKNHGSVFTEIKDCVRACMMSKDQDKRRMAQQESKIFVDVTTKKYRVSKETNKRSMDESSSAGINTSHLNLYYALKGLERLVENDGTYILLRDDIDIDDALERLYRTDKSLEHRRNMMKVVAEL